MGLISSYLINDRVRRHGADIELPDQWSGAAAWGWYRATWLMIGCGGMGLISSYLKHMIAVRRHGADIRATWLMIGCGGMGLISSYLINDRVRRHGADIRATWSSQAASVDWFDLLTVSNHLSHQRPGPRAAMLKHRTLTVTEWTDGHHTMSSEDLYKCKPSTTTCTGITYACSDGSLYWCSFRKPCALESRQQSRWRKVILVAR